MSEDEFVLPAAPPLPSPLKRKQTHGSASPSPRKVIARVFAQFAKLTRYYQVPRISYASGKVPAPAPMRGSTSKRIKVDTSAPQPPTPSAKARGKAKAVVAEPSDEEVDELDDSEEYEPTRTTRRGTLPSFPARSPAAAAASPSKAGKTHKFVSRPLVSPSSSDLSFRRPVLSNSANCPSSPTTRSEASSPSRRKTRNTRRSSITLGRSKRSPTSGSSSCVYPFRLRRRLLTHLLAVLGEHRGLRGLRRAEPAQRGVPARLVVFHRLCVGI
jgi:hypothetical protein